MKKLTLETSLGKDPYALKNDMKKPNKKYKNVKVDDSVVTTNHHQQQQRLDLHQHQLIQEPDFSRQEEDGKEQQQDSSEAVINAYLDDGKLVHHSTNYHKYTLQDEDHRNQNEHGEVKIDDKIFISLPPPSRRSKRINELLRRKMLQEETERHTDDQNVPSKQASQRVSRVAREF